MYDILDHGWMIRDPARTTAYAEALRRVVKPGHVVLDLGAGTGLFAMLACRAGARRVFAVEQSPYIELARRLAETNGYDDRIECIHADSTAIELPERADVIVSDIRGVLPLFGTAIQTLIDARERHLRRGGTMMPGHETLGVVLIEDYELYSTHVEPWRNGVFGLDLRAGLPMAVSESRKVDLSPEQAISDRCTWVTIDYHTTRDTDVAGSVALTATREGTAHGFAVGFDSHLTEGIVISNAPSAPRTIYGSVFFALEEPVAVEPGDVIELDMAAKLVLGEDYVWRWNSTLTRDGVTTPLFRQSSFFAYPHRITQ